MASVCLVSHALHLSLNFQWQWPPSPINGSFVSQAPHNSVTFQQSQLYASHSLLLQFLSLYDLCTIAELLLIKQFDCGITRTNTDDTDSCSAVHLYKTVGQP